MAIRRSLTLEWATSHYIFGTHDGIRIRLSITCAENIDKEIFAYRLLPLDPTTAQERCGSHELTTVAQTALRRRHGAIDGGG
jgi:hypothetical protein